jgi:hypothetical protein
MRQFCARDPPDPNRQDYLTTSAYVRFKDADRKLDDIDFRLVWLLRKLAVVRKEPFIGDMAILVDEMQRLLDKEPRAANKMTSYLKALIADLAIFTECHKQTDLYQPWAHSFMSDMLCYDDHLAERWTAFRKHWEPFYLSFGRTSFGKGSLSALGKELTKPFDYPVARMRTKENVRLMQLAEANLDALWARLDALMRPHADEYPGTVIAQAILRPHILQRTPEWTPPTPRKVAAIPNASLCVVTNALPGQLLHEKAGAKPTDGPETTITPSKKIKARGSPTKAARAPATETKTASTEHVAAQLKTVEADKRSFNVFRTLFFHLSSDAAPGEVPWKEFVHALVSVGFAAQNFYGSVWQFTP